MPNIAFTTIIKVADHLREFNFRKLPGDQLVFHADVTDLNGRRIQFSMKKDAPGQWRATGSLLPLWVSEAEALLGDEIEKHLGTMQTS